MEKWLVMTKIGPWHVTAGYAQEINGVLSFFDNAHAMNLVAAFPKEDLTLIARTDCIQAVSSEKIREHAQPALV